MTQDLRLADNESIAGTLVGMSILIAEDCPDQGRFYARLLTLAGASVTLECNGEAVVGAIERRPEEFDAVLLDFQLPGIDGICTAREVRRHGFEGPIVAFTAYPNDELRRLWFAAGCSSFLTKPAEKRTLVNSLRSSAVADSQ